MERIVFADGTLFECVERVVPRIRRPPGRDWNNFTVLSTVDAVRAKFVDNAEYSYEQIEPDGGNSKITYTRDMSEYCKAGEIVDNRDGTVTVFMGKKTEIELYQDAIDQLMLKVLEVE